MFSNTTGSRNTVSGNAALGLNTTGNDNTAIGDAAMFSNVTGISNVAVGSNALHDGVAVPKIRLSASPRYMMLRADSTPP